MANAAKQLNLPERSNEYLRVPYSFLKMRVPIRDEDGNMITTPDGELVLRDLNFSDLIIFGLLYSFSHMKEKPNETCVRSFSDLEEETDYSRGTIAESLWASKNAGVIKQIKHFHEKAEYQCVGFPKDEFVITFEHYLFTEKFYVPEEGKTRRLKKWEIWVISVLASICNKPVWDENGNKIIPRDSKGCEFTIEELCELSGACEKTIRKAICKAINMGFVSSRNRITYARKYKRLHFNVPFEVRRLMNHKPRHATEKSAADARREAEIEAANMSAERERYYSEKQRLAHAIAERNIELARRNDEFCNNERELAKLPKEQGVAEARGQINLLDELARKERDLRIRRAEILTRLELTEADLELQWACKKCSDTGFLPGGRMCNCYDPPGGAP